MTRESAETKGARYLTEGRVAVREAASGFFLAFVRGAGDVHTVVYRRGGWSCTCAVRGLCSHLHAARLIAAPDIAHLIAPRKGTPWTTT